MLGPRPRAAGTARPRVGAAACPHAVDRAHVLPGPHALAPSGLRTSATKAAGAWQAKMSTGAALPCGVGGLPARAGGRRAGRERAHARLGRRATGTPCRGRRGLAPSSLRPYWAVTWSEPMLEEDAGAAHRSVLWPAKLASEPCPAEAPASRRRATRDRSRAPAQGLRAARVAPVPIGRGRCVAAGGRARVEPPGGFARALLGTARGRAPVPWGCPVPPRLGRGQHLGRRRRDVSG